MLGVGAEVTVRGENATKLRRTRPPRPGAAPADNGQGCLSMPELARLRTLEDRHAALEARIADEDSRPRPDAEALARLKREKLRLKEEMERLRHPERVH